MLFEKLGVEFPLIQAPMAGISTPAMAAAVSAAGALGSVGAGAVDTDGARAMIAQVRKHWSGPLNVNLFCHKPPTVNEGLERAWIERSRPQFEALGASPPDRLTEIYRSFVGNDAMLAMLLTERPAVVSFHFGLPEKAAIHALRAAGITLLASVTSMAEGQKAAAEGIHAVVAQGWEAGGHRGVFDPDAADDRLGTMTLTRLLVRNLNVPVVAAGGIMDGAGIASALALGAAAVQLGTAFIASEESQSDPVYRAVLMSDAAHHTVMTRAISGRPSRCIANSFTKFGTEVRDQDIPPYPIAYDLGKALYSAGKSARHFGYGAHWAGQGAPLARAMPAAKLVATLRDETEKAR